MFENLPLASQNEEGRNYRHEGSNPGSRAKIRVTWTEPESSKCEDVPCNHRSRQGKICVSPFKGLTSCNQIVKTQKDTICWRANLRWCLSEKNAGIHTQEPHITKESSDCRLKKLAKRERRFRREQSMFWRRSNP